MGQYYKQICVQKTTKALLEFVDDTRYDSAVLAWPHSKTSRIRMNMKDYSKGKGELAVDVFYNFTVEDILKLYDDVKTCKTMAAADIRRYETLASRLNALSELCDQTVMNSEKTKGLDELATRFSCSRNEVFVEAGENLTKAIRQMTDTENKEIGSLKEALAQMSAEAKKTLEAISKAREIYSDIKILNFDQYMNPDNSAERRVTVCKLIYSPGMRFPYQFSIGNGWAQPQMNKMQGVMIKEGTTRIIDTVSYRLSEADIIGLLKRVEIFIRSISVLAMNDYFNRIKNPPLMDEKIDVAE